jgi:hypothetical protein
VIASNPVAKTIVSSSYSVPSASRSAVAVISSIALPARACRPDDVNAEERLARRLTVSGVSRLDLRERLRLEGLVPVRHAEVGGALEDVEMRRERCQLGDDLDSGRAGADHADALANDVDAFALPLGSVMPLPLERLEPSERRDLPRGQAPRRENEESSRPLLARFGRHRPGAGVVDPRRCGHT